MSRPTPQRQASAMSTAQALKVRKRADRFRILIIGRANSGKTTILMKVCNSTEQPAIHDSRGEEINLSVLKPTDGRGLHDINNEMIFSSNAGFIFHDSRGFEAGTTAELDYVKNFIARRADVRNLKDRVHAIWYCIPLDNPRPVTKAEEAFFAECGTGDVPVIVVFTKLDALDDNAYEEILEENPEMIDEEVERLTPIRALEDFEELRPKMKIFYSRYPPKTYVALRG